MLRKDEDARTYLVTPAEKVDVEVEDAPFLAVEMEVSGAGREQQLVFRTNVDDVVACGPQHPLRFCEEQPGRGLKPYVLVRGRLEALLTRALLHDLVALAVEEARDGVTHRRHLERRDILPVRCAPTRSVHLELGPTRRTSAGVSSLLCATVTLNSLPSSVRRPEVEEALQLRKARVKVVVLPDVALQQCRMIGQAVEDLGRRQAVSSQQGRNLGLVHRSPPSQRRLSRLGIRMIDQGKPLTMNLFHELRALAA